MNILEYMKEHLLFLDGGMGTLLQQKGLRPGESPVKWNITRPEVITQVHRAYFDAGSHVVAANTFGADRMHFSEAQLEKLIPAAIRNARLAASQSKGDQPKFVALDVAPLGKLLQPLGELPFEEAVSAFSCAIRIGVKAGADLIYIETMTDSLETKAALLAAKESCDLPVFVSNAYDESGRLLTGADPRVMVTMLEGMGADAIGVNCSYGPDKLEPVIRDYLRYASVPVLFKPNAGLPQVREGRTEYDISPADYAAVMARVIRDGVRIAGGCCGTTPVYIEALVRETSAIPPVPVTLKRETYICSGRTAVQLGQKPLLIGERLNPTGKKRMKQALMDKELSYVLSEAVKQTEKGAHILDVNCGMPGINEKEMLPLMTREIQCVTDLPLQIDTSDGAAMENALRCYHGTALINSVNGKQENMDMILPLKKKYGGVLIALTLDESGIPSTAEGRVAIAEKILREAEKYGIRKEEIIFDTLTMAVSADPGAARETLKAVHMLTQMGCMTSLGVSNVSFGLPGRDALNGIFFAKALQMGLSCAIMNPYSDEMMNAYRSHMLLSGLDDGCREYIAFASARPVMAPAAQAGGAAPAAGTTISTDSSSLKHMVLKGMKENAAAETRQLLQTKKPLQIIDEYLIPALNEAGKEYEAKRFFLPQLLLSAEAAGAAFDAIKAAGSSEGTKNGKTMVLATVKGDIHDIGKNIVRMLMENYGFTVIDLGRDVDKDDILQAVLEHHAEFCGLSALMTTTVPAMEETIVLLHEKAPDCRIIVGGAVLTQDYARKIGADHYAPDAMSAVRYAQQH